MRQLLLLLALIILIMIAVYTQAWQLVKTIWLIVQVTPYEQIGTGNTPPTVFVFGDSTGYGTGAGRGDKSIAGLMGADFPSYSITNNSKNGRTIGEALLAMQMLPTEQSYELILLQLGGNDILQQRPLSVVEGELRQLLVEAKRRGKIVVMMSCGNVGTAARFVGTPEAEMYNVVTRQFRGMFKAVAVESGVTYVDVFKEPEVDEFALQPEVYLALDGLHPSAVGYALWYQNLGPILHQHLK